MHSLLVGSCLLSVGLFTSCTPLLSKSGGSEPTGNGNGPSGFRNVILDAGHGGKDSGAVSPWTEQKEKDLTLDMVKRIRTELINNFHVTLLRSDDRFIELDERVSQASRGNAALLVSMHFNSGPSILRGPETYYWRVDSHGIAVRLQAAMQRIAPAEVASRGLMRRRLRLTRNPSIPCVLIEGGYLSNQQESKLIANPAYRQKLAKEIANAIRSQAAVGDAGTGPLPPPLTQPMSRAGDDKE